MIGTALALAAMLAAPVPAPSGMPEHAPHPEFVAPRPVPSEMTPAPGRWEVEDAPAYFSDRHEFGETARDISRGAATAGSEASDLRGDGTARARAAEDGGHEVALARNLGGPVVPLPRPRGLAAPAARPRP